MTSVPFPADALREEDIARLRAMGDLLWEERAHLARAWTTRLLAALPDALARRPHDEAALYAVNLATLESVLGYLRKGDTVGLYDSYYRATCQLIEADLKRGPASRLSLDRLFFSAGVSLLVLRERLSPEHKDLYDAYVRLANHLLMLVGKAYCDMREGYVRRVFEQMNTLAHEVRGPLARIFGQIELLKDGALGEVNPRQREALQQVAREMDDLLWLYTGTLDLSRLEAGFASLRVQNVHPAEVAREAVRECDMDGTRVRLEVDHGAPRLDTDRVKVRQILVNLLRNALRWGEGSPVTLRVRAENEGAAFEVEDRGPGIAPEQREAIFELFRTGSGAGLASDGYGIGLHIVRQLARLLGARVEVRSEPGRGSCFRVHLPSAPPDRPHAARA